jgi:L-malate glycosyltransferase
MKLLIVSHACVTPINQQFFAEVELQTGWQLSIVTPTNWRNEYGQILDPEKWPNYKGQLLGLPIWMSGNIPLHIYRSMFFSILRDIKPDIIYIHHEPYGVATTQIYLANHFSINKPIGFFTWQNIFKNYPFPFQQMERFILKKSSFAFPGSHSADSIIREKGYKGNSVVLPSGIDPNIYCPHLEDKDLEEIFDLGQKEFIIGYLGRIIEEKGLKTLLYALNQIRDLSWKLIIIGSGSFETEFDSIAQTLKLAHKIKRIGFIPHNEAPKYLSAFDLLVLPSETRPNWKEQFGRVIIEAMACGTPVIGSDSGEIPYLIEATGGGLVFPEGKPEALAEQLKKLILNNALRQELSQKGRQSVLEKFTNETLARRFAETIESTIKST